MGTAHHTVRIGINFASTFIVIPGVLIALLQPAESNIQIPSQESLLVIF